MAMAKTFEGLGINKENSALLTFLISSQAELDFFLTSFWRGKDQQFFAIANYRLHKIRERNMSLDEFVEQHDQQGIQAFENLFQQPLNEPITSVIVNKIRYNELTLEDVYRKFAKNPGMNISRFANGHRSVR